jgi:hypothetical protein
MMEKYQRAPYNGILREAGRPKNSWRRSVIKEVGRSWNELRFLAADRSGKNSQTTYAPNRSNGLHHHHHHHHHHNNNNNNNNNNNLLYAGYLHINFPKEYNVAVILLLLFMFPYH